MIRLSRLTDYAIVLLSQMIGDGKRVYAASELAERTGLPLPTTSKILKQLTKAGVVLAQRGATGGYRLARSATDISVAAIIESMDGPIAITDCSDMTNTEECCRIENICPMRANWNRVNQTIRTALDGVSLADMLAPAPFALRPVAAG